MERTDFLEFAYGAILLWKEVLTSCRVPSPALPYWEFGTRMFLGSWGGSSELGVGTHRFSSQGCYVRSRLSCLNIKTLNPLVTLEPTGLIYLYGSYIAYLSELKLWEGWGQAKRRQQNIEHICDSRGRKTWNWIPVLSVITKMTMSEVSHLSKIWELNEIIYSQSWNSAW